MSEKLMHPKKAALITGAAKRIGREIALSLAEDGYDIALHCNQSVVEADSLQQEIRTLGAECHIFSCNLSELEKIESWFSGVLQAMPHIEVLINNASIFKRKRFSESDAADFQQHMTINALAPILLTKAFAERVKRGCVINMLDADIGKLHGSHFAYLLSKKTLAEFTLMAARELAPNIRVNGICPGVTLASPEDPEEYAETLPKRLPMQELPQVSGITAAIRMLLSQPHMTGQLIFNDSGQHLL